MRRLTSEVTLVLALATGCQAGEAATTDAAETPAGDGLALPEEAQTWITVARVGAASGPERVVAPGRVVVRADADAHLSTPVAGRVDAVLVREGARVRAGEPLLVLASAEAARARSELTARRVDLRVAKEELARQERLVESGVGLEVERLRAEADVARAEAELSAARHEVELLGEGQARELVLRAPRDGVVVDLPVRVGRSVSPDDGPLVTVASTDALFVRLEVYEEDLRRVAVGQGAEVVVDGGTVPGRVVEVADAADPALRRGPVLVEVEAPPGSWVPGALVRGWVHAEAAAPVGVPVRAVVLRPDRTRVVYVEGPDGRLVQRPISVGRVVDDVVPVVTGLSVGERIVVDGALLVDAYADRLL